MSGRVLTASDLVVLDTNVLGYVTHPSGGDVAAACKQWLREVVARGISVAVPEICDFELRRELIRADKVKGMKSLDFIKSQLIWIPVNSAIMLRAANLWAQMRKGGKPTAPAEALDIDVVLAAQALVAAESFALDPIVATDNVGHLERMVTAHKWSSLSLRSPGERTR
jgi:predicted nucleic acid-binding protein